MRLSRLIKSEPSLLTKSKNVFMCGYLVHRSLFLDFSRVSACLVLNKISYKLIKNRPASYAGASWAVVWSKGSWEF